MISFSSHSLKQEHIINKLKINIIYTKGQTAQLLDDVCDWCLLSAKAKEFIHSIRHRRYLRLKLPPLLGRNTLSRHDLWRHLTRNFESRIRCGITLSAKKIRERDNGWQNFLQNWVQYAERRRVTFFEPWQCGVFALNHRAFAAVTRFNSPPSNGSALAATRTCVLYQRTAARKLEQSFSYNNV